MSTSGPAWTVTTQSETMGIGPNGQATRGVSVGFKLADGTTASVFVPDAQYTPDAVRAAIAERAAAFGAVKGLTP
jgi:hypothetical protein